MTNTAFSVLGNGAASTQVVDSTLKNKIYHELRRAIIMGHRLPGERIDIQQIARTYGTSVTPVREAIQMLNQAGLIAVKPHSGYSVTQLTLKQLRDLLEVREVLETACAERAAQHITASQIEELNHVYAGYTGDDDDSYTRYTDENRRFHCLIAEATGNQELADMVGHLHDQLARFMVMRRAGETMQYTHNRIIDALRDHDVHAARQAMLDDLLHSHGVILDRVIQELGDSWQLGPKAR